MVSIRPRKSATGTLKTVATVTVKLKNGEGWPAVESCTLWLAGAIELAVDEDCGEPIATVLLFGIALRAWSFKAPPLQATAAIKGSAISLRMSFLSFVARTLTRSTALDTAAARKWKPHREKACSRRFVPSSSHASSGEMRVLRHRTRRGACRHRTARGRVLRLSRRAPRLQGACAGDSGRAHAGPVRAPRAATRSVLLAGAAHRGRYRAGAGRSGDVRGREQQGLAERAAPAHAHRPAEQGRSAARFLLVADY